MLAFDDLPPALQTLLLAVQPGLPPAQVQRLQQLCRQLTTADWNYFQQLARHHRLEALSFHTLKTLTIEAVPEAVQTRLHAHANRNAFAALWAVTEAQRVRQRFEEAGLPLTALKGVTLSQLLYGNPNARHCGDIDLLSTSDHLPRQIELLAACGYTLINPQAPLTPRRLAAYRRFWKDFTFANEDAGFELDLHWRLFNHRLHAANGLLQNHQRVPIQVFGIQTDTLLTEDLFLYTAAHGVSDAFTSFKSLADVAGFLRLLTPAQLASALQRADELKLLPQVSAAIHLANAWMLTACESPALLPRSEALARSLRRRVETLLVSQNYMPERSLPSPARWLQLEFQLVPGLRSAWELAARFIWRPRVWERFNLPDKLFPLYGLLGLLLPPRRHTPAGQSQAAPRTPLESPNAAGSSGVAKSPPNT